MEAYEGGCACGSVRYTAIATPLLSLHCQCRDCQRITGTGHASMMVFRASKVSLTGDLAYHETHANSGNIGSRGVCARCGSFVTAKSSGYPDVLWLTAGSLDEPGRFKPTKIVFAKSGHPWDYMDPALTAFPQMPPSK
jgi:hypothetical protein